MGLRPFVYALFPRRRFLCASEPGQLLEDEQLSHDLNPSWVAYWLTHAQGHWRGTIYREIESLPPGHLITVDASGVQVRPFWQPPGHRTPVAAAAETFRECLTDAVRTRLAGAQRVFFDLSGGLDSSSLVSIAGSLWEQEGMPYSLDCFHAESSGASPYIEAVEAQYPMTRVHRLSWASHLPFEGAFDPLPWVALPCRPTLLLASFYREQWQIANALGAQAHIRSDFGDELLGASLDYLGTLFRERQLGALMRELMRWQHVCGLAPLELLEQWVIHPSLSRWRRAESSPALAWIRPEMVRLSREWEEQDTHYFR